MLISAYLAYLKELEAEGILQSGKSTMEIDIDAQRAYLKARGDNVADMTDDETRRPILMNRYSYAEAYACWMR